MFSRYLLKALVLPPFLNILIILFALFLLGRWRRLQVFLIAFSTVLLLWLSLPATSQFLAAQLETHSPIRLAESGSQAQAIVVLGGGRVSDTLEYGGDVPKATTLERLRYAARLQRRTGLPLLVSGGKWKDDDRPEAELMAEVLEKDLVVSVTWREGQSRTTWENAEYSARLLQQENIDRIILVTHAWHMPRAVYSFKEAGFKVFAAPTIFRSTKKARRTSDYIPSVSALHVSTLMLHEILGLLTYRLMPRVF